MPCVQNRPPCMCRWPSRPVPDLSAESSPGRPGAAPASGPDCGLRSRPGHSRAPAPRLQPQGAERPCSRLQGRGRVPRGFRALSPGAILLLGQRARPEHPHLSPSRHQQVHVQAGRAQRPGTAAGRRVRDTPSKGTQVLEGCFPGAPLPPGSRGFDRHLPSLFRKVSPPLSRGTVASGREGTAAQKRATWKRTVAGDRRRAEQSRAGLWQEI